MSAEMTEEDTELRDLVVQTLETKGVLGKIRAQLRASVFLALEEQENVQNKSPFVNKELRSFLATKDGQLITGLVREYLEYFSLEFTKAVFDPECGFTNQYPGREHLARELDILETDGPPKGPLLLELLKHSPEEKISHTHSHKSLSHGNSGENFTIPKDLTSKNISDAKKKFDFYDKDKNGYIDKNELRILLGDMFPNFHTNMLERYANDEFKAADTDFSSGIDFDEFLGIYRRLFLQCRSVVSHDVNDILPHNTKKVIEGDTVESRNRRNQDESNKSLNLSNKSLNLTNKSNTNGGFNDFGSDPEEDPFFDDPPLPKEKSPIHGRRDHSSGSPSNTGTLGMSSLQGLPALNNSKSNASPGTKEFEKEIKGLDQKLSDLGVDDEDAYEDDFLNSSGGGIKSARSEKSKTVSIAEEVDEELEISGADELLKSGIDDITTDHSISLNSTGGFDYLEDVA